jgi:uncharacterized protein (TIGR02300 family)
LTAITAEAHRTAITAKRGLKRTCESDECGKRFYDLNKAPVSCPYCGSAYLARVVKPVNITAYVPIVKGKHYKIEHVVAEPDETASAAEIPAADIEETETADAVAEEIPEIEDEDLDEGISGVASHDET